MGLLDRNKHEARFSGTALWATQNYWPKAVFKILQFCHLFFKYSATAQHRAAVLP